MRQIDKESLSALLDNEADDLELRRLLKSCEQDSALLKVWERYSLVQSVLHAPALPVSPRLSQKIAQQIETEAPLSVATVPSPKLAWQQGLAKMAIAASVAAVVLFTFQISLNNGSDSTVVPALANQPGNIVSPAADLAPDLLAETAGSETALAGGGIVREYIESLTLLDEEEPIRIEHIQDSPLYHLVNDLQARP